MNIEFYKTHAGCKVAVRTRPGQVDVALWTGKLEFETPSFERDWP